MSIPVHVRPAHFFTASEIVDHPCFETDFETLILSDVQRYLKYVITREGTWWLVGEFDRMIRHEDCFHFAVARMGQLWSAEKSHRASPVTKTQAVDFVRKRSCHALTQLVVNAIAAGHRAVVRTYLFEQTDVWADVWATPLTSVHAFGYALIATLASSVSLSSSSFSLSLAHEVVTWIGYDALLCDPEMGLRSVRSDLKHFCVMAAQCFNVEFFAFLYVRLRRDTEHDIAHLGACLDVTFVDSRLMDRARAFLPPRGDDALFGTDGAVAQIVRSFRLIEFMDLVHGQLGFPYALDGSAERKEQQRIAVATMHGLVGQKSDLFVECATVFVAIEMARAYVRAHPAAIGSCGGPPRRAFLVSEWMHAWERTYVREEAMRHYTPNQRSAIAFYACLPPC